MIGDAGDGGAQLVRHAVLERKRDNAEHTERMQAVQLGAAAYADEVDSGIRHRLEPGVIFGEFVEANGEQGLAVALKGSDQVRGVNTGHENGSH